MHITVRAGIAAILTLACSSPALAKTTVVAELGTAPLLGPIASTGQMRDDVAQRGPMLAAAAGRLGITPGEYAAFRRRVAQGDARWVTVPRHLDAMSWRSGRHVRVIRDVEIPANTHGWEVDLNEGSRVLAVYMPARCGNLSVVVRPLQRVAQLPKPLVAAASRAPATAAAAAPAPAEVTPPAPEAVPAEVAIAPAPVPRIEAPVYTATHFSPLAIIPVLFGFGHGGGGGGGGAPSTSTSISPGCGTPHCY